MKDWKAIRECMIDAGCSTEAIERAENLWQSGRPADLLHCLRTCRCDTLEEIHEKQKQLDRMDMLIRDTKNMGGE